MINNKERIEMLREAQKKLREAVEFMKSAFADTDVEAYANAYIIAAVESRIDGETWVTGDEHLESYIERFQDPDYGLEESDDTEDAEPVEWFDDSYPLSEDEDCQ